MEAFIKDCVIDVEELRTNAIGIKLTIYEDNSNVVSYNILNFKTCKMFTSFGFLTS